VDAFTQRPNRAVALSAARKKAKFVTVKRTNASVTHLTKPAVPHAVKRALKSVPRAQNVAHRMPGMIFAVESVVVQPPLTTVYKERSAAKKRRLPSIPEEIAVIQRAVS
jgi:hypothetical protein